MSTLEQLFCKTGDPTESVLSTSGVAQQKVRLSELIQQHCPCLTAGRLMGWSIKDFPIKKDCWYVYVLLCDNGSLYKGFTDNPIRRFKQHQSGQGANHTKQHRPLALIYFEEYPNQEMAVLREKKIKSGIGREQLKQSLSQLKSIDIYE